MKRLFVLSGGGLPGLDIHAGMLVALAEAGIHPTHLCGTSAGAIIAALYARALDAGSVASWLAGLRDDDVRAERRMWKFRALWLDHWLEHGPIRQVLGLNLPLRFSDLRLPVRVVATRVRDAQEIWLDASNHDALLRESVLASMSICGVFPPVVIGGETLVDGGVRANLPLPADWQSYDEVWCLVASRSTSYPNRHSIPGRLMWNAHALMEDQIDDIFDLTRGDARVRWIRPEIGLSAGSLRFDHSLIEQARHVVALMLADGFSREANAI